MIATALEPLPAARAIVSRRPPSEVRCNVLDSSRRISALDVWRELEVRLVADWQSPNPITCSHAWTSAWLAHYGDIVPHEFLLATVDGAPVGVALLTHGISRKEGPFRIRTRHLGTAGERPGESVCVEYNRLLVDPRHRGDFEEALVSHVLHDKSWESFCLDGFAPGDAQRLLQDIPGAELRRRECPYYDLRGTRESNVELLERLGRSTRQNTRRLLRKYGDLDVEWAETAAQAGDILNELIALHQERWKAIGQPGAFHSERFTGFQRSLVQGAFAPGFSPLPLGEGPGVRALGRTPPPSPCPLPEGEGSLSARRRVVLFRVSHQRETVGCLLLLVDGNRLLDYLSGFADFEAKPSPGVVTHVLCMEEALRRGYDAYDFLVGEKRHKQNLSTDVAELVWATWTRRTFKTRTIDTLRNLKRRWTRFRTQATAAQPATVLT